MKSWQLALLTIVSIVLVGCGGNASNPTSPSPSPTPSSTSTGTSAVSIPMGASSLGSNAFNPNPLTVSVGATVRWTNDDTITHTSTANNGTWNSSNVLPGGHFDFTFQAAGTYAYHCAIHPGMVGTVVVQ
jgi:plastocyanin